MKRNKGETILLTKKSRKDEKERTLFFVCFTFFHPCSTLWPSRYCWLLATKLSTKNSKNRKKNGLQLRTYVRRTFRRVVKVRNSAAFSGLSRSGLDRNSPICWHNLWVLTLMELELKKMVFVQLDQGRVLFGWVFREQTTHREQPEIEQTWFKWNPWTEGCLLFPKNSKRSPLVSDSG